ncbi:MAG: HAMP domain-containing histidine kinase [Ruminococcus sp.]|nr:HAMP domain-containing histidine kinase [Ruminococcus sp.]
MKTFKRIFIIVTAVFLVIAVMLEVSLSRSIRRNDGICRVEAKRLAEQISETGSMDLSEFPNLTGVFTADDGELYLSENPYVIVESGGQLYRVEYKAFDGRVMLRKTAVAMGALFLLILAVFLYIWRKIILPFGRLSSVPQELARGNLAVAIPEEKSRFFGKFTWGVNMLRESVEDSRRKEISMQRDKKLLLLSLSHDIKTPLSAIKLNAKALAKGLYQDEEKRRSAAESINSRADEIENFVSQITQAASEDFMTFEVVQGEAFLSQIIGKIHARYAPQLAMSGTELKIDQYEDGILSCDPDRLGECLQNLVENAIKYGDGRVIEIGFDRMDGCQLICVSNSGCQLERKELPQIFESFHRGSNSAGVNGNGLGLFICKRLMGLMGGEVYADIKDGFFNVTLVVKLA